MANVINLVTDYLPVLDAKFVQTATSSILEADETMYRNTEKAKTIKIAKVEMDGMGDYDRATGYADGDITSTWEDWTFSNDRGRRLSLDTMDNVEGLLADFLDKSRYMIENYIVPEIDAYRYATIASTSGITSVQGTLTDSTTKKAITTALATLVDNGCDMANTIIFINPFIQQNLEDELQRSLPSGETKYGQIINYFNGIPLVPVPSNRFFTAIDLLDGKSSGQTKGGYKKHVSTGASGDANGADINFIALDKRAVFGIMKHVVNKVMTPEQNPFKDGWLFFFRYYHDLFVMQEKASAIYVHHK